MGVASSLLPNQAFKNPLGQLLNDVLLIRYRPLFGQLSANGHRVFDTDCSKLGLHRTAHIGQLVRPDELADIDKLISTVRVWQLAMREEHREDETRLLLADYFEELLSYEVGAAAVHELLERFAQCWDLR